jgi:hypothetical protein
MEGLVVSVLGDLRIAPDWPRLIGEVYTGEPPSTPLGVQEAAWLSGRPGRAAA